MKVKAKEDFVAVVDNEPFVVEAGEVVEMPKGADWIKAGFVYRVGRPRKDEEDEEDGA